MTDVLHGINWCEREALGTPFESAHLLVWYQGTARFAWLLRDGDGWKWEVPLHHPYSHAVNIVTVAYEGITWVANINRPNP